MRTAAPPGPHAGGASAKASAGRRGAGQCPLPVVPGDAASTAEQHTDSSAQRAALCAAMRMEAVRHGPYSLAVSNGSSAQLSMVGPKPNLVKARE